MIHVGFQVVFHVIDAYCTGVDSQRVYGTRGQKSLQVSTLQIMLVSSGSIRLDRMRYLQVYFHRTLLIFVAKRNFL